MCTFTTSIQRPPRAHAVPWTVFALPALAIVTALAAPQTARVLWLLAGAPLAEELIFRAGLQAALAQALARRHGTRRAADVLAVVLSSLAFAAAHAALPGATVLAWATVLPSLVLGAVYLRTGRLAPCVALHAAFNALWLAMPPALPITALTLARP